jgi:hypothetical protein
VSLASRGQRDMDTGVEAIADPAELVQVRRQAHSVHRKSLLLAIAIAILLSIPWLSLV